MKAIFNEAKNLINNDGNVWLWNTDSSEWFNRFSSDKDAQKFAALCNQEDLERNIPASSYSIGSEADFKTAKKAKEVQRYCQHVDKLIKRTQLEVKALDGLIQVCRQFDGKVLNKRFHDAVEAETGFKSGFGGNNYKITYYGREYNNNNRPFVSMMADSSHGRNQYCGIEWLWLWNTGDRLDAQKAVVVIAFYKKELMADIQNLKDSKKKYSAYLRLARKAESIMKEMKGYDYEIRAYARDNALSTCVYPSAMWK